MRGVTGERFRADRGLPHGPGEPQLRRNRGMSGPDARTTTAPLELTRGAVNGGDICGGMPPAAFEKSMSAFCCERSSIDVLKKDANARAM